MCEQVLVNQKKQIAESATVEKTHSRGGGDRTTSPTTAPQDASLSIVSITINDTPGRLRVDQRTPSGGSTQWGMGTRLSEAQVLAALCGGRPLAVLTTRYQERRVKREVEGEPPPVALAASSLWLRAVARLRLRGAGAGASAMPPEAEWRDVSADEWFARLDTDKNGVVTRDEVKAHFDSAPADALRAIGFATVAEAVAAIYQCVNTDKDDKITPEELRRGFDLLKMRCHLSVASTHGLEPHDFSGLWHEKVSAHLQGTREWAFSEILAWLDDAAAPQLFWLMGGGGTGKSVLTAELLRRSVDRTVAWHFCRHDNPAQSAPTSLLRSLATMLAHRLPGYKGALEVTAVPSNEVTDPRELFTALFETPLQTVPAPEKPLLLILDALDELPKESQKPLLDVIAGQLSRLPTWLKLFTTSREEPQIKQALSKFTPKELRADEAKNRADVEVFLRAIAREHVKGEVSTADLEADVKRKFGLDMGGKLESLQLPMEMSKAIYNNARAKVGAQDRYRELIAKADNRNDALMQASDEYIIVYKEQAPQAQEKLMLLIADKWEADPNKATLQHPVQGTAREWVESADSPGIKSEPRVSEKMKNDYNGHANKLKDLARLTLRFSTCSGMVKALEELEAAGIKVLTLKNKYASPTPMGYSDFNLCVGVRLPNGILYVCELQINHVDMIAAKHEAHVHYEKVRTELPALCRGTTVDAGDLEAFIVGRLSTSSLEAAVEALSAKAEGLFLYAYLLKQHLEGEANAGREINFQNLDSLPAGLGQVYNVNFQRAFPKGKADPAWLEARPLVELVAAAREPITVTMAAALLKWDDAKKERVLEATALLFPVRDGKLYVFHKTIVDWLTGEIAEGSSIAERSKEFVVERGDGHAAFASGFDAWLGGVRAAEAPYWLLHGVVHLCRAGRVAEAAKVYATDLALLQGRADAGDLASMAKDYLELRRDGAVDLAGATEMRRFMGKYTDVLQREKGAAVMQLALQQPDATVVFRAAASQLPSEPTRTLKWRNKPQEKDACIATLSHKSGVDVVAVSAERIVGGSGNSVFVYDAETEQLLEELEGTSEVKSVAIWDGGKDGGEDGGKAKSLIAAGFADGTLKVWDPGEPLPTATPLPKLTEAVLHRHSGAQGEQRICAHRP